MKRLRAATATKALHAAVAQPRHARHFAGGLLLLPSLVASALLAAADRRCALSDHSAVGQ